MSERAFEAVIEEAAKLLSARAFPLVAGLGADVAGVVAALRLAERLGGAVDHSASEAVLREAAVLHDAGLMSVSPGEARQRADTLLFVGERALRSWPDLSLTLISDGPTHLSETPPARALLSVGPGATALPSSPAVSLACDSETLPGMLGALRARVGGRPAATGADLPAIDRIVERLKAARFGVAVWSPDDLDALTIEMLSGLIKDLNAETRWSAISVAGDITAAGATIACGWMTGYPLRVGFGRGFPEYDPWRFEARRLVESGEADSAVWISALGEAPPAWLDGIPIVHIGDGAIEGGSASVNVAVGRPARDHDAVLFDRRTGTLVQYAASGPTNMPTAADALNGILARLAER
jgi:formylmethanofuran dehydrogenase subunit B